MAKKSNKVNTNFILSIVALVGALVAGIGLFLNVWTAYISTKVGSEGTSVKIFNADVSNCDAAFCARVFEVGAIIVVIAIIVSVVLAMVTKKNTIVNTILNIASMVIIVVAIICAIVFFIANHEASDAITVGIKGAAGFYMIAFGGVIGSVCAFLASRK